MNAIKIPIQAEEIFEMSNADKLKEIEFIEGIKSTIGMIGDYEIIDFKANSIRTIKNDCATITINNFIIKLKLTKNEIFIIECEPVKKIPSDCMVTLNCKFKMN